MAWVELSCAVAVFFLLNLCFASVPSQNIQRVLVLDVDGTLYDNDCFIEDQIRDNCHVFAEKFGCDPKTSDDLHKKYGSTICGICENGASREVVMDYYNEVYPRLDMSRLKKYSKIEGNSGYSVEIRSALKALRKFKCPIVIASNSPVFHVQRVLTRIGLGDLPVSSFLTPERRGGLTKCERAFWDPLFDLFPKEKFECTLVDDNSLNIKTVRKIGMRGIQITPQFSLAEALLCFSDVLPIDDGDKRVRGGRVPPVVDWGSARPRDANWLNFDAFKFEDFAYLSAKNEVDAEALSVQGKNVLARELAAQLQLRRPRHAAGLQTPLHVVDLGGGLLNMLPVVMDVCVQAMAHTKISLDSPAEGAEGAEGDEGVIKLTYVAFESNEGLLSATIDHLNSLGLRSRSQPFRNNNTNVSPGALRTFSGRVTRGGRLITEGEGGSTASKVTFDVTVHVAAVDFMTDDALVLLGQLWLESGDGGGCARGPDLIVGSSVADLVPSEQLVAQLVEIGADDGGLVYLPITFAGGTRLKVKGGGERATQPQNAFDGNEVKGERGAPLSDEEVFAAYHEHLSERGHHLCPRALVDSLRASGCEVHSPDDLPRSPWNISLTKHPYMWRSMIRFLSLGTVFRFWGGQGKGKDISRDIKGWFHDLLRDAGRVREGSLRSGSGAGDDIVFEVDNVDVLARLPSIEQRMSRSPRGTPATPHSRGWRWLGAGAVMAGVGSPEAAGLTRQGTLFGVSSSDELRDAPPLHLRSFVPLEDPEDPHGEGGAAAVRVEGDGCANMAACVDEAAAVAAVDGEGGDGVPEGAPSALMRPQD